LILQKEFALGDPGLESFIDLGDLPLLIVA
jgi:hypothetical protein